MAQKFHPDVNKQDKPELAQEKFIQVKDAYESILLGKQSFTFKSSYSKSARTRQAKKSQQFDKEKEAIFQFITNMELLLYQWGTNSSSEQYDKIKIYFKKAWSPELVYAINNKGSWDDKAKIITFSSYFFDFISIKMIDEITSSLYKIAGTDQQLKGMIKKKKREGIISILFYNITGSIAAVIILFIMLMILFFVIAMGIDIFLRFYQPELYEQTNNIY